MSERKPWEEDVLVRTRLFVDVVLRSMPKEVREEVVARVYSDMRRVLKPFNEKVPSGTDTDK